jgi:TolB-like protein
MNNVRRVGCALLSILLLPPMLPAADKPVLAVLDLTVDQVSVNEMKTLIALLTAELFRTEQFQVIDVAQRDSLLKEIEFSQSDCTDESCQVEIGKLLAAEYVVVGRVGKIGKKYVVALKLLETSSARTVRAADGTYDEIEKVLDDLGPLAGRLAGLASSGKPTAAARRASPLLTPQRLLGAACALGAAGSGTVGAILLAGGIGDYRSAVAPAYEAYLAAPEGSASYDALYAAYVAVYTPFMRKTWGGIALAAGGVALGGTAVALFVASAKRTPAGEAVSVLLVPEPRGVRLGVRVAW